MRSRLSRELTEQQELLSIIRKARREHKLQLIKAQKSCQMREKRKLEAREHLVKNATASAAVVLDSGDSDYGEDSDVMARKKKAIMYSRVLDCEMNLFIATLKKTDVKQLPLNAKSLRRSNGGTAESARIA